MDVPVADQHSMLSPFLHDPRMQLFLKNIAFIASIGFGLTISSAVALASSTSFFGATDVDTMSHVRVSANVFVKASVAYGLALVSSIACQSFHALTTSTPKITSHQKMLHNIPSLLYYTVNFVLVWAPVLLIIMATQLVGGGLVLFTGSSGLVLAGGSALFFLAVIGLGRSWKLFLLGLFSVIPFSVPQYTSPVTQDWIILAVCLVYLVPLGMWSAYAQLKLLHQKEHALSSSMDPHPVINADSPITQTDFEQSAGLNPSPENVLSLPSMREHVDLEAITTQLASLVQAVERLAAQNAVQANPTSTPPADPKSDQIQDLPPPVPVWQSETADTDPSYPVRAHVHPRTLQSGESNRLEDSAISAGDTMV
jgi:hypothetical protein